MTATQTRRPDAVLLLPQGVQLTLFRNVKVTMEDKTEVVGDWMVAIVRIARTTRPKARPVHGT